MAQRVGPADGCTPQFVVPHGSVTGMSTQAHWQLDDWLRWQERLNPREIELGLARVGDVARRLQLHVGHPPTLTVAGTNGKGSSATLAAGILREAGYRTGLYTSPHLLHYRERVAIDGVPVRDEALCRAFRAIESVRGETRLTYFEFGTLAALWLFREAGVQAQVLEVGLGGRLDAVNLVDADVALITSIGLDHTDWLGPDRDSIGREKAGVLRAGRPAVCADPDPPASIAAQAVALGAPLLQAGRDFRFEAGEGAWHWQGPGGDLRNLPLPGLRGAMQLANAAGAIAAVRALRPKLTVNDAAIRRALPKLQLPGRYQRIGKTLLDVAHNAEAAQVLADNLRAERVAGDILLVLGMFADKPVESVVRALSGVSRKIFVGGLPGPRGLDGAQLADRASRAGRVPDAVSSDVAGAYAQARAQAQAEDLIVVTGSFMTVAAVAADLHE